MEMVSGAMRPFTAAAEVRQPAGAQRTSAELPNRPARPVLDRYVPEEAHVPAGRYWVEKDADGTPRICFDNPEAGVGSPPEGIDAPPEKDEAEKRASDKKTERCTSNTDKVDRELKRLREEREELERQLRAETDGSKAEMLERKLARIESELRQKDNDAYRRQHTVFS